MTPERYARVKAVFLEACRRSPDERDAYLAETCEEDAELRAAVERLLQFHVEGEGSDEDNVTHTSGGAARAGRDTVAMPSAGREPAIETSRSFQAGTIIAGRYRIVAALGVGGMGEVYRAEDTQLDQTVALKFLPSALARDPGWLIRLRNEVRVAREVTHPDVCRVYDIGEADGEYFISMEYVDGEDLRTLLRRIGRLPRDKALQIAHQLCAGLAAAHAKGVLHRDLKPANIMIDGRGNVRLMDFGLAGAREQIRGLEVYAGTPAYMAPEQITGADVSVRSDIYALGLVLYELFTGRPAFQGDSRAEYVRAHQSGRPTSPSTLVPDIDPEIERVILRCLAKEPDDRPDSALAVSAALPGGDVLAAALAAGETPSPELVAQAGETSGLRKPAALGLAAAFVAGLAVIALISPMVDVQRFAATLRAPVLLREAAREQVSVLAEPAERRFEAAGLTFDRGCALLRYRDPAWRNSPPEYALPAGEEATFWYRQSEMPLAPRDGANVVLGPASTSPEDPSPLLPGMVSVVLASGGELIGFEAAPTFDDDTPAQVPDWASILARAGFDLTALTPAKPITRPRLYADVQAAWVGKRGKSASQAGESAQRETVRIEAAARGGRLATLAVLREVPPAKSGFLDDVQSRGTRRAVWRAILMVAMFVVAVPLARINLQRGRGDLRGARRVAWFVFGVRLAAWVLTARFVADAWGELVLIVLAVAGALVEAGLVWLYYVALEPYVRRFWPQTIISWSRALEGRFRDPLVGRNVLVGAVLGVAWAVLVRVDRLLPPLFGLTPRPPVRDLDVLTPLLGGASALAAVLIELKQAIYDGLLFLLLVVVLRMALRRPWAAGVAAAVLLVPMVMPISAHPAISWLTIGVLVLGSGVVALMRFGLVTVVTALFLSRMLSILPPVRGDAWYADAAIVMAIVVIGVGAYGLLMSTRAARGEVMAGS